MPHFEPVSAGPDRYAVRLVGPRASVFPSSPAANTTVLARTDMVARKLQAVDTPAGPDWVSGTYTLRLGDSGECSLLVPNTVSSDGVPWAKRLDPGGHLQWLEIYEGGELAQVCVIDKLPQTDEQQVQVHGSDAWFLLKKAYERDWIVTQSPRDVIERATRLWVPAIIDSFPAGSLNPKWTVVSGAHYGIGPQGGFYVTCSATTGGNQVEIKQTESIAAGAWSAVVGFTVDDLANAPTVKLDVIESGNGGSAYEINWGPNLPSSNVAVGYDCPLSVGGAPYQYENSVVGSAASYALLLESDGEWVSAYVNGVLVGSSRRIAATSTSLTCDLQIFDNGNGNCTLTIGSVYVKGAVAFLQPGSDKGDYALPGTASTYPIGGLHARYFNDLDMQSNPTRLVKIHRPSRTQAYGGSSNVPEYANQQDAQIASQAPPTGAAGSNWSCVWFGAIWLPLSKGDIGIGINAPAGTAFRVWVGKTQFGQQLIDNWTFSGGAYNAATRLSAASLAGTLSYGGGTVQRDGWYPIKVEYAVDATAQNAPILFFAGPSGGNLPYNWTDPGGTSFTTSQAFANVPGTSLSPLGCVDQRYQGISHFDLAQQTAQASGYQISVEPYPLESGLFPGVLAPRIREGHDTDVVLKPDRSLRRDGEGLINYSSSLDATDYCASLQGNGAGLQSGSAGQLQALVYDPATLNNSLFDAQGWQDFSDAGFPSLLQALLNSQLGLRLSPWQALQADPLARARWANTWPLPGNLAKMRWRPGDGLQIQAPEINVVDTAPRQILVLTRNFTPTGQTGTQATFANRPRTPAHTLKQQLYQATRWQRNYQRERVALPGSYQLNVNVAPSTLAGASVMALSPGDQVISAQVRILQNSAAQPLHIYVNGTDATSTLGGPWTKVPASPAISATPDSLGRIYVGIYNAGTVATTVDWQLVVDVIR